FKIRTSGVKKKVRGEENTLKTTNLQTAKHKYKLFPPFRRFREMLKRLKVFNLTFVGSIRYFFFTIPVNLKELVAIKIIDKYQMKAGKSEIRVMDHLRQLDPDKNNLVRFNEHFRYKRSHCLSFEILDISLFDYIAGRRCKSLTLMEIRVITQQMLVALDALKSIGLVHGDIKPDNIMLVDRSSLNVKLIDFGLAFQTSQIKKGWLVQNPSYRAFEVMLGLSFNEGIDMWSLGCVLGFLHIDNDLLKVEDVQSFIDLLKKMFELDPQKRISPAEALGHNFITMKHLSGNPDNSSLLVFPRGTLVSSRSPTK
uniref:Protein kinase domain-containing protein n=1 Tax=Kryptolebias marmoratus TaxID=37003 RepID=A0A3Q3BR47_KRYMA